VHTAVQVRDDGRLVGHPRLRGLVRPTARGPKEMAPTSTLHAISLVRLGGPRGGSAAFARSPVSYRSVLMPLCGPPR